jgi:hypothetical protein
MYYGFWWRLLYQVCAPVAGAAIGALACVTINAFAGPLHIPHIPPSLVGETVARWAGYGAAGGGLGAMLVWVPGR